MKLTRSRGRYGGRPEGLSKRHQKIAMEVTGNVYRTDILRKCVIVYSLQKYHNLQAQM
jgi:hypothetical protein